MNDNNVILINDKSIIVSKEDFDILNAYKWTVNKDGYAIGQIHGKKWRMHRYIYIEILKIDIEWYIKIDHINNNKLDNRRENLRIISDSNNARNKLKSENTSSKYYGVSKMKEGWRSQLIVDKKLNAYYDLEEHAAWQYNLWIKEYNLTSFNKLNDIIEPINFKSYTKNKNGDNIPKNISLKKNGMYHVQLTIDSKYIHYGYFDNLDDAKKALKKAKDDKNKIIKENLKIAPVEKNNNGEAIILLYNKKREKIAETIVDEKDYYKLIQFKWRLHKSGYVLGKIENKDVYLHRHIMKYYGKKYIDHINNNKLDNKKENLRIVTPQQNSMNKTISDKSFTSSKYLGVNWHKGMNKWESKLTINGNIIRLGYFDNEIDAAKARDISTKEHFGEYGKYNFT